MAIKSRIKSFVKKTGALVSSAVSAVKGAFKGASQTAGSQVAAVGNAIGANKTTISNKGLNYNNPVNNALQMGGVGAAVKVASVGVPSFATPTTGAGATYGPALPVTISSSSQKTKTSSGTSATSGTSSYFNLNSPLDESAFTGTISSASLGGGSSSSQGATQGGSTGGTYSNSPYSLPPAYKSTDPGNINTTGLAGSLASLYTRNEDGTFEPVQDGEKSDEDIANEKAALYKKAFGEPTDVYDDPEVKQAQEDRRRAQEALLAPTAELNAILSQAQRDNLQLRQTAMKEGVVEAVYGQQAAAINYNAAIRALPLQAHIAALQDNLELAQDYVKELTTIKKEQIKTQYDYNKGLFDTIYSALDAKEKRVADKLIKENDRAYKAEDELIDYKATLLEQANANKAPATVINAIERSTDKISAAKAAGRYGSTVKATLDSATGGGTYVAGANPTVDAWAERIQNGTAKITDIPASQSGLRNAVTVALQAMGNSTDGKPVTTELGKAALQSAKDLLSKFDSAGKKGVPVGIGGLFGTIRGSAMRDFSIQFDTLKSQLSLDAVKYLKGQGAVSDAERSLLSSSVSSLNRSQSKAEFRKTLAGIVNTLSGGTQGQSEEEQMKALGYTDEQIQQLKSQ